MDAANDSSFLIDEDHSSVGDEAVRPGFSNDPYGNTLILLFFKYCENSRISHSMIYNCNGFLGGFKEFRQTPARMIGPYNQPVSDLGER